jgi:hypothetical protein
LPKITIMRWFFPSKLISKCCNFSMDWDRVKCFSVLVTRYLMINLGSFIGKPRYRPMGGSPWDGYSGPNRNIWQILLKLHASRWA